MLQRFVRMTVCGLTGCQLALATPVSAQPQRAGGDSTTFVITGTGERFVRPNTASMVLAFGATDSTLPGAAQQVARRADSLRRVLEKLGVPRDSVVSASNWYWWRQRVDSASVETGAWDTTFYWRGNTRIVNTIQPRRRRVWRVLDRVQVRIGNPEIVGRVFDAAMALGIADVSEIQFSRANNPALADTLLQEAARDARRRAELLAAASGMRIERLIELSTQEPRSYSGRDGSASAYISMAGASSSDGETQIRPADIRIAVTVFTRWRLTTR
jgi:uncharacterized protein YggE